MARFSPLLELRLRTAARLEGLSYGAWRERVLRRAAGCPMPAIVRPATDALGVAIGDHHILRAQPVGDATPLDRGGSGRLDPIDARLWIIDVAAAPAELLRQLGIG